MTTDYSIPEKLEATPTKFTAPPREDREVAVSTFTEGPSSEALKEFAIDSLDWGGEFEVVVDEVDVFVYVEDARREEWAYAPCVAQYYTEDFYEVGNDGELAVSLYILIALGECGYTAHVETGGEA